MATEAEILKHLADIKPVQGKVTFQQFEDFVGKLQEVGFEHIDPELLTKMMDELGLNDPTKSLVK
jgi:hypothetical protein